MCSHHCENDSLEGAGRPCMLVVQDCSLARELNNPLHIDAGAQQDANRHRRGGLSIVSNFGSATNRR
eukprot:3107493-Amphidinium_carterae.3